MIYPPKARPQPGLDPPSGITSPCDIRPYIYETRCLEGGLLCILSITKSNFYWLQYLRSASWTDIPRSKADISIAEAAAAPRLATRDSPYRSRFDRQIL